MDPTLNFVRQCQALVILLFTLRGLSRLQTAMVHTAHVGILLRTLPEIGPTCSEHPGTLPNQRGRHQTEVLHTSDSSCGHYHELCSTGSVS